MIVMAKQKKTPKNKAEDSVMYKAAAALVILCIGFFLLQFIGRQYGLVEKYDAFNAAFKWIAICGGALTVAGIVTAICGKGLTRKIAAAAAIAIGAIAISALLLFLVWYEPIGYLYFFLIAGCVLYLISLLYPKEFTTIAALATAAGAVFYLHGRQQEASTTTLILYVLVALANVLVLLITMKAAKKDGKIIRKGKVIRVFSGKAGPMPLYLAVTVLGACILVALIFGGTFAYYCTYAAAAALFIAACYYTIRLD